MAALHPSKEDGGAQRTATGRARACPNLDLHNEVEGCLIGRVLQLEKVEIPETGQTPQGCRDFHLDSIVVSKHKKVIFSKVRRAHDVYRNDCISFSSLKGVDLGFGGSVPRVR